LLVKNKEIIMSYTHYSYRLRSSGPFPVGPGKFITHTFKAERSEITVHEATTELLVSEDMTGASLTGEYVSASYNALPYTLNGEIAFSGSEVKKPEYINEDYMPGIGTICR